MQDGRWKTEDSVVKLLPTSDFRFRSSIFDLPSWFYAPARARRYSSQSRMPSSTLKQRCEESDTGSRSARTQRDTSSARSALHDSRAISTRTSPKNGSRPRASRSRRYQLATVVRRGERSSNAVVRAPASSSVTTVSEPPVAYSVRCQSEEH